MILVSMVVSPGSGCSPLDGVPGLEGRSVPVVEADVEVMAGGGARLVTFGFSTTFAEFVEPFGDPGRGLLWLTSVGAGKLPLRSMASTVLWKR